MKNKYIAFTVLIIALIGCEKGFELERNNPNDKEFIAKDVVKISEILYNNSSVACSFPDSLFDCTGDKKIGVGYKVWLHITMKNTGDSEINGIKTIVTSESKIVTIEKLPSNQYLTFVDSKRGTIRPNSSGYSEITDGKISYSFAPNYNSYAIKFFVDKSARKGDSIVFNLSTTDDIGNLWNDSFSVFVE